MILRLLLGLASPLVKLLGVSALTEAMDLLKRQFDAIEARQADIEKRLAEVEKKNQAVFDGWALMSKARNMLPHAPAADPHPEGETLQQRARRFARHVTPDPDPTPDESEEDGDEPPESHV